jgi:DNA uptake protein ComE-like DNA-binding protein
VNHVARRNSRRPQRLRHGVALVIVMWVVLVSGLMLVGVMKAARTQRALAHGELSAVEAHWLARAGVEQAMAVLEDDDDLATDSTLEKWYSNPAVFENVELGTGSFSVRSSGDDNRPGLDDESSKINLNVADKPQLTEMKTMSDGQINALLEWRAGAGGGGGSVAASAGSAGARGAGGARSGSNGGGGGGNDNGSQGGYYTQLQFPYEMRGGPLQTHRELFLVRGFEDRSFFGKPGATFAATGSAAQTTVYSYQTDHDPKGAPRINMNTTSAQDLQEKLNFTPQLAQGVVQGRATQQYQNLAALLNVRPQQGGGGGGNANGSSPTSSEPPVTQMTLQWLAGHAEQITVSDDARLPAKINVNTASHDVLITLPGINGELADRIITQRSASGGVFRTLADLLDRRVLEQNVLRNLLDKITVRSDVFSVESVGVSAGGVQRRIFAVIDRGQKPVGILYWYQTQ